jgi:DNA-binding transcriptional MerR regulator
MSSELPPIPDKRYFTIGEVGYLCQVKAHVLRYWEQEFPQLNPNKRRGNRRYYQHEDVVLIRHIRHLLYDRGFTISGARQQLVVDKESQKKEQKEVDINAVMTRAITELEAVLADLAS